MRNSRVLNHNRARENATKHKLTIELAWKHTVLHRNVLFKMREATN